MPTPLGHLIVPLALRAVLGPKRVPPALLAAGAVAALLPDADVVGYWTGVVYESRFGHRGFSHSISFAFLLAIAWLLVRREREGRAAAFAFVFASGASHGVLDALTNGGLGVAFLSPFDDTRFFAPFRPIQVATISPERFFSEQGVEVLRTELVWLVLPALVLGGLAVAYRRQRAALASR